MPRLAEPRLLTDLVEPGSAALDLAGLRIAGITADSRAVEPGFLFAALPGSRIDGRMFIDQAVAAGAVAVLAPPGTVGGRVPVVAAANPRLALARLASRAYGRQPRTVVAVTGTSGKTSVAWFTREIWSHAGCAAASLGTLGLVIPGRPAEPGLTTPDPVSLHAALARASDLGIDHLAMEASSHGLDQYRLDAVTLKAGAFTNFSLEHLDYHGSMAEYFAAKAMLFDRVLPPGSVAVLNGDTPEFPTLSAVARDRGQSVLRFGRSGDLAILERWPAPGGQHLVLSVLGARVEVRLPLAGTFQAVNAVCALGLAIASGVPVNLAIAGLERLSNVPGRLQHVAVTPGGAPVYVDYAHKPDALETVLAALRPYAAKQLIVVFGCGGDRDTGKRPIMGEIASRLADRLIVTDDNPRTEDPAAIRRAVLAGCDPTKTAEIGDRARAIREAVRLAGPEDVVVVAGKGHEQGQIIGTEIREFDDASVVRQTVDDLEGCGV